MALTFVLVPLQCAAEEHVFSGHLRQTRGSWLRHPAFAILFGWCTVRGQCGLPVGCFVEALPDDIAGWLAYTLTGG